MYLLNKIINQSGLRLGRGDHVTREPSIDRGKSEVRDLAASSEDSIDYITPLLHYLDHISRLVNLPFVNNSTLWISDMFTCPTKYTCIEH